MSDELVINDTPIVSYDEQLQTLLCKMTNWQKSQYCRLKKKGLDMPIESVQALSVCPHRKVQLCKST